MVSQSGAFALGVLTLLIALAIPASIAVTESQATETFDLDPGDERTVTQSLSTILEDSTATEATITLRDVSTMQSETQTLQVGETGTYTLGNESMNVTLLGVEGSNANASYAVTYSRTYGWHPGAKRFIENLPFILVAAFGAVVVGMVGAMRP